MLKETITYTDLNGIQQTRDFYFNLSKAELARMEMRENLSGGLRNMLQAIIDSNDGRRIMDVFEEIIGSAYGVRSEDGQSFVKTPEQTAAFKGSPAYDELFMRIVTDAGYAASFIRGIVPADLAGEVDAAAQTPTLSPSELARQNSEAQMQGFNQPKPAQEPVQSLPHQQYVGMTREELDAQQRLQQEQWRQQDQLRQQQIVQGGASEQTIGQEAGWATPPQQ